MLDDTQENVVKERSLIDERVPLAPPTTLPVRHNGDACGIARHDVAEHVEIELSIEFPLKNGHKVNDVALLFKRFISVLSAADKNIRIVTWEKSSQNQISKAIDISYDKGMISK